MTHNEPWVLSFLGYRKGIHAPGLCSVDDSIKAAHHLLLSHGMALKAMKAFDPSFKGKIGIALNLSPVTPVNDLEKKDRIAANRRDLFLNRFFMDALFEGKYPGEVFALYPILNETIQPGDMQTIASPLDFLGVNYYTRTLVKGVYVNGLLDDDVQDLPNPYSSMWEFYPEGFETIIEWIWDTYHPPEIMITENGTALNDEVTPSGEVNDDNRIHYIREHLQVLHCLIEKKIPITGYFVWSLLDNFEWSYGYSKRFGLIYVDFSTLNRIPKKSAKWFGDVCKSCSIFT
jgi:beta-glucosidase